MIYRVLLGYQHLQHRQGLLCTGCIPKGYIEYGPDGKGQLESRQNTGYRWIR